MPQYPETLQFIIKVSNRIDKKPSFLQGTMYRELESILTTVLDEGHQTIEQLRRVRNKQSLLPQEPSSDEIEKTRELAIRVAKTIRKNKIPYTTKINLLSKVNNIIAKILGDKDPVIKSIEQEISKVKRNKPTLLYSSALLNNVTSARLPSSH